MGRKTVVGREKLIDAAWPAFVRQGYEAASMREIARAADASLGLAYKYFENKSDLFDASLRAFFAETEYSEQALLADAAANPFYGLARLRYEVRGVLHRLERQFPEGIHRETSVRIRDRGQAILQPVLEEIVSLLLSRNRRFEGESLRSFLTGGILGSCFSPSEGDTVAFLDGVARAAGTERPFGCGFPRFASESELGECRRFAEEATEKISPYDRAEFWPAFEICSADRGVLTVRNRENLCGMAVFSAVRREIRFLSVREGCRRRGLGEELLLAALLQMPEGGSVTVPLPLGADASAEAFLIRHGFVRRAGSDVRGALFSRNLPENRRELFFEWKRQEG